MKLIPEREDFVALLMKQEQDYDALKSDIKEFVSLFKPLLDEIQAILVSIFIVSDSVQLHN